ncbi:peroxisomal biogenesis factor 3 [Osmia lignaria lignaria]|uniref:peroxisomal biogenesis factor 3 n=1 Tax=Osmia bicornis bicornis TaxID=1437191 RepID=UPI0010F4D8B8|nr:peroxisomal biogenesis factor 3 [Osmia bicornis bicornis]XP_034196516.1 peroxisomal biogenesis factor 3 [Osmia lignaria]XP_034196517.1 peroxisomal biogenesis factor 3 [Osmia lignaria]XP_034196518.1 peroxisomal biogenesis factor 3 [Osmia lignaria]
MFSRIRGFVSRHRRKFILGGIVFGSVVFIRYTTRKLREWQEKEIKDMLEKTKRRQYFECTERTCSQMIMSLTSTLRDSIIKVLDTEAIVNKLRNGCPDKVACWNELKVLAIARSAVVIYSYAMLATLIRIQFNVMGGHVYKDIQNSNGMTTENIVQTKYMSLSRHFIYDGIKKLSLLIKDKVAEITASISLKDELTLRDIEEIYWAITSSISADSSKDPIKNLAEYMLLLTCEDDQEPIVSKLINETLDLLESEEVQNLTQSNIRSGFSLLVDHISAFFVGSPTMENGKTVQNGFSVPGTSSQNHNNWKDNNDISANYDSNSFVNINKISMPMAKIIPIVNGQVPDKPTAKDFQTDLLQQLVTNSELKTLGANIYEAFSF